MPGGSSANSTTEKGSLLLAGVRPRSCHLYRSAPGLPSVGAVPPDCGETRAEIPRRGAPGCAKGYWDCSPPSLAPGCPDLVPSTLTALLEQRDCLPQRSSSVGQHTVFPIALRRWRGCWLLPETS